MDRFISLSSHVEHREVTFYISISNEFLLMFICDGTAGYSLENCSTLKTWSDHNVHIQEIRDSNHRDVNPEKVWKKFLYFSLVLVYFLV